MSLVELTPVVSLSLSAELDESWLSKRTTARIFREDLDEDGHPDLPISYATMDDNPQSRSSLSTSEARWNWRQDGDRWSRQDPSGNEVSSPPRDAGCK